MSSVSRHQPEQAVDVAQGGEPRGREFLVELAREVGGHLGAGADGVARGRLERQADGPLHRRA